MPAIGPLVALLGSVLPPGSGEAGTSHCVSWSTFSEPQPSCANSASRNEFSCSSWFLAVLDCTAPPATPPAVTGTPGAKPSACCCCAFVGGCCAAGPPPGCCCSRLALLVALAGPPEVDALLCAPPTVIELAPAPDPFQALPAPSMPPLGPFCCCCPPPLPPGVTTLAPPPLALLLGPPAPAPAPPQADEPVPAVACDCCCVLPIAALPPEDDEVEAPTAEAFVVCCELIAPQELPDGLLVTAGVPQALVPLLIDSSPPPQSRKRTAVDTGGNLEA
uniref:Putative rhoa gtpase effector dia/diaphanous n=1 Tax=Anopheles marajoara TaxID=58244 RepID=A0A2M4C5L5_9DIPT